jgi:putative transposase
LDYAWQRWFKRISGSPKFKTKHSSKISITETDPGVLSIKGTRLKFPKIGTVRIVLHRPLEGKIKSCTIKKEVDRWTVYVLCEVEIDTNVSIPTGNKDIGIDRGVINILADSNDHLVKNPCFFKRLSRKLAKAQRQVDCKVKGSSNREKAKLRVSKIHRKISNQRKHFMHQLSTRYVNNHDTIVIEKLNVQGMVKSNCASRIQDSGWSILAEMLKYKSTWQSKKLIEVNAHYSSQTCNYCNHVDKDSRKGEKFLCTKCGHCEHADTNAAKVILSRMNNPAKPAEESFPRKPLRTRKVKKSSRVTDLNYGIKSTVVLIETTQLENVEAIP